MNRIELTHIAPYLASLLLSTAILIYSWFKRQAPGAAAFGLYMLAQTLKILGFIFETISSDLGDKIVWDQFEWLCNMLAVFAIPLFAIGFTEHKPGNSRKYLALSLIAPVLFSLLLATNDLHHWVYRNQFLTPPSPFSELKYEFGPAVYIMGAYTAVISLWSGVLLFRRLERLQSLYSGQTIAIIIGFLIPLLGAFLPLFGIQITPERDATPFSAAIGNLIIAWGVFRFRIFDVTPIARDNVFEALVDPVVILDNQNNVVDINSSMLALLNKTASEIIGEPAKKVFEDFPIPIRQYMHVTYARAEAMFEINRRQIHYELTVWPIYNAYKEMTGRIYISHDITALKELEGELRKLNTKLEDRVQARTRELAEAYESMLEGLARALELRDKETEGHSRRVTETALKIAQKMSISGDALEDIRSGAILHDIGKISIPDEILHKRGKLTPEERLIVEQHPETAFKLLSRIPFFLSKAIEIPYCHHEKWDGTGYPRGLAGEEIPLSARIFAIADVWDALSNDRPYNQAWPRAQIIEYFIEQSGRHFDPVVAKLFLSMVEKGEI